MERGDRAAERVASSINLDRCVARRQCRTQRDEVGETVLGGLTIVGGHGVSCPALNHCAGRHGSTAPPVGLIEWTHERSPRDEPRAPPTGRARIEPPDLSEKGGPKGGQPQRSDDRLFMQLLAFGGCRDAQAVARHLAAPTVPSVVYEDVNDPQGHRDPDGGRRPVGLRRRVRPLLNAGPCATLTLKPRFTMLGRTYSLGYEPDLRDALIDRPRRTCSIPHWRGPSGIRSGAAAGSRSCRPRSSARSSPSTARSAWRSAPATTRTTSGSPATASTATTTTSSSA